MVLGTLMYFLAFPSQTVYRTSSFFPGSSSSTKTSVKHGRHIVTNFIKLACLKLCDDFYRMGG